MEQLTESYIESEFQEDVVIEIYKAFKLLEQFNYEDYEQPFISLLMTYEESDPTNIKDLFLVKLVNMLNVVISAHKFKLYSNTSLYKINEFLDALYNFQYLNDYSFIESILESEEDIEEIFSEFISSLSCLTKLECLDCIEEIEPEIIDNIRGYIMQKNENSDVKNEEYNVHIQPLLNNIKLFKQFLATEDILGFKFVKAGVLLGMPFKTYINIFKHYFKEEINERNANNLLSVIYLSRDGFENPINTFRLYGNNFIHDIGNISKIDSFIINTVDKFQSYKKSLEVK